MSLRDCARLFIAGGIIFLLAGCSQGPTQLHAPPLSPEEAGREAIAMYDTNKDGFLDAGELERCPALKNSLKLIDRNGDGKLSADEIAGRLAEFQARNVGLIGFHCKVTLNGEPLEGATVRFVPEKFMGPHAKPASGVSDARGAVQLSTEGQSQPGAHWGFYRIEVSKKSPTGTETLPAKYNTATTLGQEVPPDMKRAVVLNLSSG
jgi:hypothetical protein